MYKNFEEYQKRYFEKYYKQVSKIETNKKYSFSLFAKQFSFLSFVLVFSYFVLFYDVNVNSKYNSEEEKYDVFTKNLLIIKKKKG
jgi:hypothetical protein